jgi:hypothetical protein
MHTATGIGTTVALIRVRHGGDGGTSRQATPFAGDCRPVIHKMKTKQLFLYYNKKIAKNMSDHRVHVAQLSI